MAGGLIASSSDDDSAGSSTKPVAEVWPLWKLTLIALPQLGVQVLWCFIGPNSAPYMLQLGMRPSLATLNNIAGPIIGFFTGPIVGGISDNLHSKFGRRRPIILAGLILSWIAGMLFASAKEIFGMEYALYFAVPMKWMMDLMINILQTPFRALVSDLASEEQQNPMQVVFVFLMAIGNFVGFSIMLIYKNPAEHMQILMFGILVLNTICIGIQFIFAKETPLTGSGGKGENPIRNVVQALFNAPGLLYQLAAVQCLVWIGNTAWNNHGEQWMANYVLKGDQKAPHGSPEYDAFGKGVYYFGIAGQLRSVLQLLSALAIIAILLYTKIRPKIVYAPCIYAGAVAAIVAAFVVQHNYVLAIICMTASVMPETGSFAIPFGLVATLNKRAEEEGKPVSTALQMALLNCCITVGQQVCTLTLAGVQSKMTLAASLPIIFMVAATTQGIGGTGALFLDDKPPSDGSDSSSGSDSD